MAKNIDKVQTEPIDLKVVARLIEHFEWVRFIPSLRRSLEGLFSKKKPHPIFDPLTEIPRLSHPSLLVIASLGIHNKTLTAKEIIKTVEKMCEQSGNILDSINLAQVHITRRNLEKDGYINNVHEDTLLRGVIFPIVHSSLNVRGLQIYDHYFGDL